MRAKVSHHLVGRIEQMAASDYIISLLFCNLQQCQQPVSVDSLPSPKRAFPELSNMLVLKMVDSGQTTMIS